MKKLVRHRTKQIVGAFVSGFSFIGFGILVLLMIGKLVDTEAQNAKDISYQSMEENNIFWFEELTVVGRYASLEDSDVNYFIVSFEDMDGHTVLASLSLNPSEDPWDATKSYLEDSDASVGDCVLQGYYELQKNASKDADTRHSLFRSAVSKYTQSGAIPYGAISLKSVLRYTCESHDDLIATTNTRRGVAIFMGIFAIAIGILAIYAGIQWTRNNKKLKAQQAAAKKAPQASLEQIFANSGVFTNAKVRTAAPAQPAAPTQPAAPAQPAVPVSDKMAKLNEYKALMDAGYMTQEEFDQKRKEILQLS